MFHDVPFTNHLYYTRLATDSVVKKHTNNKNYLQLGQHHCVSPRSGPPRRSTSHFTHKVIT